MSLRQFNRLSHEAAEELLQGCLEVQRWVAAVASSRPFRQLDDLFEAARDSAFPLSPAELEAALAGREATAVVPPARRGETVSERQVRSQLSEGVEHYRRRFGRPFLIRTEGRTAAQILVQLWKRLGNDVDLEDRVLAQQLRETALIRLANVVYF